MGAVLRISGARQYQMVQAENTWTPCSFEFEVQELIADVELICEVQGAGSAWFDLASLRVVRLD